MIIFFQLLRKVFKFKIVGKRDFTKKINPQFSLNEEKKLKIDEIQENEIVC